MSLTNAYITTDDLAGILGQEDQTFSATETLRLEHAINAASRQIDEFCNRKFYLSATSSRDFIPMTSQFVAVDDIGSVTDLTVSTGINGSFSTSIAIADIQPDAVNALAKGKPITGFLLRNGAFFYIGATGSNVLTFGSNIMDFGDNGPFGCVSNPAWFEATVRVTAQWGWPTVPPQVTEACLLQAMHIDVARRAPDGIGGNDSFGPMRLTRFMHPTAQALLSDLVRTDGAVSL